MYIIHMGVVEKVGNAIQVPWIVGSAQIWQCLVLTPQFCCSLEILTFPLAPRGQAINELFAFLLLPPICSLLTQTE